MKLQRGNGLLFSNLDMPLKAPSCYYTELLLPAWRLSLSDYVCAAARQLSRSLSFWYPWQHQQQSTGAEYSAGLFRVVSVYSRGRGRPKPLRPPLAPFIEGAASNDYGSVWGTLLDGNSITAQHHCKASLHSVAAQCHCTASLSLMLTLSCQMRL